MAEVVVSGVFKRFGPVAALQEIDLTVHDNEFVVLVGPSGSGKSTLLRIVAGLERQSEGSVSIDGRDMAGVAPKDRDVAMVFQSHALYPHMNVFDNLAFNQRIRGVDRKTVDRKVREVAERLEITELLRRRPRQMSGGQRQRVAIGRALVRDPRIFLFDEPLSNLDAELRVRLRTVIKRLHQEMRRTSVYVTHDQVEAMTLADRVVVLRDGRIEQVGDPDTLYERPANEFVAGFIGSPAMNFLPGTAAGGSVRIGEAEIAAGAGAASGAVTVGIRPEDLLPDGAAGTGAIQARVTLVEPMGADTLIFCTTDEEREITVRLPRYTAVREGETLSLAPRAGAVHLFEPETGQRLD
ncbi:MAG: ABC transporter ATP-binding protein [Rhodospirillales bacterium]|nr:ABC transporter ATP-binding protein [Rhodospirillales bacterium]MDE0381852.1 ABC transporter ATP-binding protein [Rhodospirillales bacterium]